MRLGTEAASGYDLNERVVNALLFFFISASMFDTKRRTVSPGFICKMYMKDLRLRSEQSRDGST